MEMAAAAIEVVPFQLSRPAIDVESGWLLAEVIGATASWCLKLV